MIQQKVHRLNYQYFKEHQNERAKRTRTIIQLGGLVIKSGLAEKLTIPIGEDLQKHHLDKAAILLGFLIHTQNSLTESSMEIFKEIGRQKLFESANKE
jgi:hypothetical protein